MTRIDEWRRIVASALDWEQAHLTLEQAVHGLAPELRGRRPELLPYSAWELLEHIRLTQNDLLEFMRNPAYQEPAGMTAYWPEEPEPPDQVAWQRSIVRIQGDRAALQQFATGADLDLTGIIPHGTGQTYLRTVLVAVDHTAYHVGQIVAVRRALRAWPGT